MDDLTANDAPQYRFTPVEKWVCEKHGECYPVRFYDKDGKTSRDFCGHCVGDLIQNKLPILKPIEEPLK